MLFRLMSLANFRAFRQNIAIAILLCLSVITSPLILSELGSSTCWAIESEPLSDAPRLPNTTDGPTVGSGPSTGTLLAAALETAGYVAQDQILNQLKEYLNKLGALVYLICLIGGIVTFAMLGNYQMTLWFLIGPPLFYFLLMTQQAPAGVKWQFGAFEDKAGELKQVVENSNIPAGPQANVSWFFHRYNVLVSDTIQQLIKLVTNSNVKPQAKFMARQLILDDLLRAPNQDPGVEQLARYTMAVCYDEMSAARIIARGERESQFKNAPEYSTAIATYCEKLEREDKPFINGPAKEYVQTLPSFIAVQPSLEKVSCYQLWAWLHEGLRKEVENATIVSVQDNVQRQLSKNYLRELLKEIEDKTTAKRNFEGSDTSRTFECPNGKASTPSADYRNKSLIPLIFSGWMLKKMWVDDARSEMTQQIYRHSGVEFAPLDNNTYGNNWRSRSAEVVRRYRLEQLSESVRYEAYTVAKTLPYVQGAGLYFLALSFPFFAFLVLIPGKAGSFFNWLALWAWLKAWDLGWALVMVADELLWELLPHSSHYRLGPQGRAGVHADPVTVMEAAFAGDHAYNLSSYYILISAMITAVPMLSGQAILGSKRAIAGIFVDGLKTLGQTYGGAVGDWVATEQLGPVDRAREMTAARAAMREAKRAHDEYSSQGEQYPRMSRDSVETGVRNAVNSVQAMAANVTGDSAALGRHLGSKAGDGAGGSGAGGGSAAGQGNFILEALKEGGVTEASSLLNPRTLKQTLEDGSKLLNNADPGKASEVLKNSPIAGPIWRKIQGAYEKDHKMPTVQLELYAREQSRIRALSQALGAAAELSALGMTVNAPMTQKLTQTSIELERMANKMAIDLINTRALYAYYQASTEEPYAFYESIRAGISDRPEHWGLQDFPLAEMSKLELDRSKMNYDASKKVFEVLGYGASTAGGLFR